MNSPAVLGSGEAVFAHSKPSLKRHLLPPVIGILVIAFSWGLMNSQIIVGKVHTLAYRAPQISDQPTVVTDKKPQPDPGKPARITIIRADVAAPVVLTEKVVDEKSFQIALRDGVVHYPGTALPGRPGNAVLFGHSSGQVWAPGDYKFVFAHLEELKKGDKITLNYQGIDYVYSVTGKRVVPPTDVSVLAPTEDNGLTLITCTPVGTDKNRLVVTAEQVLPKPVAEEPDKTSETEPAKLQALPGDTSPSLWDSIRSIF